LARVRFRAARRQAAERHGRRHELQKAAPIEYVDDIAESRHLPFDHGGKVRAVGKFF
jgi:hypothetical protein